MPENARFLEASIFIDNPQFRDFDSLQTVGGFERATRFPFFGFFVLAQGFHSMTPR
jgi:hypothetical protein